MRKAARKPINVPGQIDRMVKQIVKKFHPDWTLATSIC
jgi:hypothetical protein